MAYTPEQIAEINRLRAEAVEAGKDPYEAAPRGWVPPTPTPTPEPAPEPTPVPTGGISTSQEVTKTGVYTITTDAYGGSTRTFLRSLQLGDVMGNERYSEAGWTPISSEEAAGLGTPMVTAMFTDYVIRGGDTLSALAIRHGTTVNALVEANRNNPGALPDPNNPNLIIAGKTLKIPTAGAPGVLDVPEVPEDPEVLPTSEELAVMKEEELNKTILDLIKTGKIDMETAMEYWRMASESPDRAAIEEEISENYGISGLEERFFTRPAQTFEEIYQTSYDTLGLGELKAEIDAFRADIEQADADYIEATGNINENPWISEAGRVGKTRRVTEEYNKTITKIQNQLTLAESLYSRGKQEAENTATRALNTFSREKEWDRQELEFYMQRVESEVSARVALEEREGEQLLARYFPEWMAAMPEEEEAKKEYAPPTSYKEWELAGGKAGTGMTYAEWLKDKDEKPPTIKEATADMKTQLMTVRGADGYISPSNYKIAKEAWFQAGWGKDIFDKEFEKFANPSHIGDYGIAEY